MTTVKILLVEDEGVLALQIKNDLKRLGHTVVGIFTSGEDTLAHFQATGPELVLMDIHLDGKMDGIETAQRINDLSDIPVIFLTAHSEEHIIARVKTISPYGYLLKPVGQHDLHIAIQIALARHSQERQLKEMQRWLATVLRSTGEAIITVDTSFNVTLMNPRAEEYTGWTTDEAVGKKLSEVLVVQDEVGVSARLEEDLAGVVAEGRTADSFSHHLVMDRNRRQTPIDGNAAPIRDKFDTIVGAVLTFRDITNRQRVDRYRNLSGRVLEILNTTHEFPEAIDAILNALQTFTGCSAVGLRLESRGDYPYLAQRGFSGDFLRTENTLVVRDLSTGGVCRNEDGSIKLECTCGLVLAGKTDPAHPLFSAGGSFWTNNSLPLLDLAPKDDPRLHPRNHCIHHGFMSVALIPIREQQRIVGLLQLNDRRRDVFSLEIIQLLEGMANDIGAALLRKDAARIIKEQAEFTRNILDSLDAQIAIIDEQGILVDVNGAWRRFARENDGENLPSLAIGASYFCHWGPEFGDSSGAAEAFAGIRQVLSGKLASLRLEYPCHSRVKNRWFSMHVLPLSGSDSRQVLISHTDISSLKETEENMRREVAINRALSNIATALTLPDSTMADVARVVHEKSLQLTGSHFGYVATIDPENGDLLPHTLSSMLAPDICMDPNKQIAFHKKEYGYDNLYGYSLITKEAFFTNTPKTHPSAKGLPEGHVQLTRFLSVPALYEGKLLGQIALANAGCDYTQEVMATTQALANLFALAVFRKRAEDALVEKEQRLQAANDTLEQRVKIRTQALLKANKQLLIEMDERQMIEKSLEIQRDIHAILSTSNQVLLFGKDREAVVRLVCGVAADKGLFNLVWVGFVDDHGYVKVASAAGAGAGYLSGITITTDRTKPSGKGPTGTCVRTNRPCVNDDSATNPALQFWRDRALDHGLRSSVAIPIRQENRCIGALSLYAPEPGFFTKDRVALLEQLAANLSAALDHLQLEARTKAAVASLRQSEEKYRIVADNTYDWEFWLDPEGRYTYVSPACARITGHSAADFLDDPQLLARLVHPEDLAHFLAHRHDVDTDATGEELVFRIIRPDGQVRWIEHLCQPVFSEFDRYLGHRGSNRDITERKKIETQIFQSKKRLQAVFDGISEPLIFVDKNMGLKMVNFAAVKYFGLTTPLEVLGRSCCDAMGGRIPQCDHCPIPAAVAEEKHLSFVREGYINPDRREDITIFPISAETAGDSGAVIRISDITEKAMMEKALVRTEKLASIGVLSAGVAHEINNPNNFIMFNIPVLRRYLEAILPIVKEHAADHDDALLFGMTYPEFAKDLGELTDSIENGSQRIQRIVAELKEFSSLDDQEKTIWANPEEAIHQSLRLARVHLKDTVKRVEVEIPEGLPDTFFEIGRLEQVIVNMLINAAHAADKEDSWVRLAVRVEAGDVRSLVIEIADNGCGMNETSVARIFDPFFTTKAPGIGTGLGLYVCHNLIHKVDGRIEVQSRVGEGSTFRIYLHCR